MASTGEAVWRLGRRPAAQSIGSRFERQPNALNFLRLCLALEVIVWHAYALRGSTWLPSWAEQFLAEIAVDSFFAISGFLICRAWVRNPNLGRFLSARGRRILPGLWACLLVTAFLVAPLVAWAVGTPLPTLGGQLRYIAANAGVWMTQAGIDDGGALNGSLWSLGYEAGCYGVVALAGVLGLVRRRAVVSAAVVLWMLTALMAAGGVSWAANTLLALAVRTGLMFACGAALFVCRDRVPSSRLLTVVAAVVVAASLALSNYRVVAAPAVAYLMIYGGLALGRFPVLVLRGDLSYGVYVYAFPIQVALLACGVSLGWAGFTVLSVAAVLPAAALSWRYVEEPFLRRREPMASVDLTGAEPSVA